MSHDITPEQLKDVESFSLTSINQRVTAQPQRKDTEDIQSLFLILVKRCLNLKH